jgi:phosphosulfolactate synthase
MTHFLDLPERTAKPRAYGLTHVIEKGLGTYEIQDFLGTAGHLVDIVKLGWGTAYVTGNLSAKIRLYQEAGITVYLGGSLFEIALAQNRVAEYCQWLEALNIDTLEVSNGMLGMLAGEKKAWIRRLSRDFTVISEVGSKDPNVQFAPQDWAKWCEQELDAGAKYVIAEGRETGSAGIFDPQGNLREEIVHALVDRVTPERIIFEVPVRKHQTWFIQTLGANVNLGNIPPADVIGLETLRLGLRSDTFVLPETPLPTPETPSLL